MAASAMLDSRKSLLLSQILTDFDEILNIRFSAQHATAKSKLEALHKLQYDRHHHLKKTANIISKKLSS